MARIASVDVAGGGNAGKVAAEIARLTGAVEPARYLGPDVGGEEWEVLIPARTDLRVVDDDPEETEGYPVSVSVHVGGTAEETEQAAADLYDLLARNTDWALRLLNVGTATLAERPAVVER